MSGEEAVVLDDDPWADIGRQLPADGHPVRRVYAATRIVMRPEYADVPHAPESPGSPDEIASFIDWDETMARRRWLDGLGFGIAEAMDTAQRFSLGWPGASELIRRTGALGLRNGFVAGASADHEPDVRDTAALVRAVIDQCEFIAAAGGVAVILPMAQLVRWRAGPDEYVSVYRDMIDAAPGPLLVHWLGPMFAPELAGYFPQDAFERIMALNPEKVRGAKLSMLDERLEVRLRAGMLQRDQLMFTGDDFHFGALLAGPPPERWTAFDDRPAALGAFSHGLLGVFDAVAQPVALGLRCLAAGRVDDYWRIMRPCEALGQRIFEPPTQRYKTGLAFLAWLNGAQDNPMLANHEERCRGRDHLFDVVRLAAQAGAITSAPGAASRLRQWSDAQPGVTRTP